MAQLGREVYETLCALNCGTLLSVTTKKMDIGWKLLNLYCNVPSNTAAHKFYCSASAIQEQQVIEAHTFLISTLWGTSQACKSQHHIHHLRVHSLLISMPCHWH